MSKAYKKLIEVFETEDDPKVGAHRALEILRDAGAEIEAVGVSADSWRAAVESLLDAARRVDAGDRLAAAAKRRKDWLVMSAELEKLGCQVTRVRDGLDHWRITHRFLDVEVNLENGEIEGLEGELCSSRDPFRDFVRVVTEYIEGRDRQVADQNRRRERGKSHRYDFSRKVWLPKSGIGPVIKGGS